MKRDRRGVAFLGEVLIAIFLASLLGVALYNLSDQQRHMDQLAAAKLSLGSAAAFTARTLMANPALAVAPGAPGELSQRLHAAGMGSCRVQLAHQPHAGGLDAITITAERKVGDRIVSAQMVVIIHAL
jgi:hypothetical protein